MSTSRLGTHSSRPAALRIRTNTPAEKTTVRESISTEPDITRQRSRGSSARTQLELHPEAICTHTSTMIPSCLPTQMAAAQCASQQALEGSLEAQLQDIRHTRTGR